MLSWGWIMSHPQTFLHFFSFFWSLFGFCSILLVWVTVNYLVLLPVFAFFVPIDLICDELPWHHLKVSTLATTKVVILKSRVTIFWMREPGLNGFITQILTNQMLSNTQIKSQNFTQTGAQTCQIITLHYNSTNIVKRSSSISWGEV